MIPLYDGNPTRRTPVITLLLVAACAAVYFFVQPSPFSTTVADASFDYAHAVVPVEIRTGDPVTVCQISARQCAGLGSNLPVFPRKHVYLGLLESMFLHGSIVHLAGNVLFLWVFGNNVEDRLGRARYLIFYLVGGFVSAVGYVLVHLSSATPLLGASGAIAATMGAYLVWFPRARVVTLVGVIPLPLPAWLVLAGWFVLQFFTGPNSQVAWIAHVAGFAFGAIVGLALRGETAGSSARSLTPPGRGVDG